jgi:hypothetical protein
VTGVVAVRDVALPALAPFLAIGHYHFAVDNAPYAPHIHDLHFRAFWPSIPPPVHAHTV